MSFPVINKTKSHALPSVDPTNTKVKINSGKAQFNQEVADTLTLFSIDIIQIICGFTDTWNPEFERNIKENGEKIRKFGVIRLLKSYEDCGFIFLRKTLKTKAREIPYWRMPSIVYFNLMDSVEINKNPIALVKKLRVQIQKDLDSYKLDDPSINGSEGSMNIRERDDLLLLQLDGIAKFVLNQFNRGSLTNADLQYLELNPQGFAYKGQPSVLQLSNFAQDVKAVHNRLEEELIEVFGKVICDANIAKKIT